MKDHLSSAILSTINHENKVSNEDTESMRKTYLTIFEEQEKYHSRSEDREGAGDPHAPRL